MKRIILNLTASLDGFIEGPQGEIDWIVYDDEIMQDLERFADRIDTILYGRTSYELYGNYIPPATASQAEHHFYKKVHQKNKYVFTNSGRSYSNATTVQATRQTISEIISQSTKDIWLFGGSQLITTFVNENWIDEYHIAINPVILGNGNPLFRSIQRTCKLKYHGAKSFNCGVVTLYYHKEQV